MKPCFRSLTVPPEKDGCTVRHLLKTRLEMAEGYIAALKTCPDGILLNGLPVHTNVRVRAGDTLSARIDDREGGNPARPEPVPLRFVWEDNCLAVLEKPAGLVVHGTPEGLPTLANALAFHWGAAQPFHPVHRLDRGTTGLLVVAKSAYIAELLRRRLHTEDFNRGYLALIEGELEPAAGEIRLPLGPMEGERCRQTVRRDGKSACTFYRTEGVYGGLALLRLRLDTGRSHQIRAHLAALGHPLPGDMLYGGKPVPGLDRPALHAAFLTLRHPVTGEVLELCSRLPEDMERLLKKEKRFQKDEVKVFC